MATPSLSNGIFNVISFQVELLDLCKRHKPAQPKYVIDQILRRHGHEAVHLPPYHPDLNPIELVWSKVKRGVAEKNFTFKISDIERLTHDAMDDVSNEFWDSCCRHVQDLEQKYWEQDIAIERQVERVEFMVTSSDEATDTASDDSETEDAFSDTCI